MLYRDAWNVPLRWNVPTLGAFHFTKSAVPPSWNGTFHPKTIKTEACLCITVFEFSSLNFSHVIYGLVTVLGFFGSTNNKGQGVGNELVLFEFSSLNF